MDKQPPGESHSNQAKAGGIKKRATKSTRTPAVNQNVTLRPRASTSNSRAEEEPMRSKLNPVHDEHVLNQRRLNNLNLCSVPDLAALSTPPGIGTSPGKSKKRPAASAERGRKLTRYSCGNDSPEKEPDNGSLQQSFSPQSQHNNQNSAPSQPQNNSAMLNFDPPLESASRIRPLQSKPTPSDRPAPAPQLSITPRKHLFPPGEWNPVHQAISAELLELLQMKAVTRANNNDAKPPPVTPMVREPIIRQLTHPELVKEVRGIHYSLVVIELLCQEEDSKVKCLQKLTNTQYAYLIKCHRALLCEHHDLYLSSQHPIACAEVLGLAAKHQVPSRVWAVAILPLLEIMRSRLPDSLEHMIEFIHHAFNMLVLILETVPRFKSVWLQCLGDISRYRMAIEVESEDERRVWSEIARYWYNKGIDENHGAGRLHHHLGILAMPNMGQQLFLFSKSLMSLEPFFYSRTGLERVFDMALDWINPADISLEDTRTLASWYVSAHAMLMRGGSIKKFIQCTKEYLNELTIEVNRLGIKFRETAICLANPNFAAMFQYGDKDGIIMKAFINAQKQSLEARFLHAEQYWAKSSTETSEFTLHDNIPTDDTPMTTPLQKLSYSTYFTFHTLSFVLEQRRNMHAIPHIHISLAFIWSLALVPESM
ncbi:hypothetical protein AJ78_08796, partial [Emergomyces pasteurianus Ep9510]